MTVLPRLPLRDAMHSCRVCLSPCMSLRLTTTADVSTGVLATLLTEMDGVQGVGGVIVIAATNRPETLDPALLRCVVLAAGHL